MNNGLGMLNTELLMMNYCSCRPFNLSTYQPINLNTQYHKTEYRSSIRNSPIRNSLIGFPYTLIPQYPIPILNSLIGFPYTLIPQYPIPILNSQLAFQIP